MAINWNISSMVKETDNLTKLALLMEHFLVWRLLNITIHMFIEIKFNHVVGSR